MPRPDRSRPMPVKHWSRAGLMLTDWCCASCACCYANCSPGRGRWMTVEQAVGIWQDLAAASPHGCRVHLTGGEVFGRYDLLLEVCRTAHAQGLELEAVETNGFWADAPSLVRSRLAELDAAGMGRLVISADPFHQQYVPIERPRLLAAVAEDALGRSRVRVRWADWLAEGFDTAQLSRWRRDEVFAEYAAGGRDRLVGRAAEALTGRLKLKPPSEYDDNPCGNRLLRGRHVHVAPGGEIWPATCVGIVAGNALREGVSAVWKALSEQAEQAAVIGPLSVRGPVALLDEACQADCRVLSCGYASKCHLCYRLRQALRLAGRHDQRLGPAEVYGAAEPAGP